MYSNCYGPKRPLFMNATVDLLRPLAVRPKIEVIEARFRLGAIKACPNTEATNKASGGNLMVLILIPLEGIWVWLVLITTTITSINCINIAREVLVVVAMVLRCLITWQQSSPLRLGSSLKVPRGSGHQPYRGREWKRLSFPVPIQETYGGYGHNLSPSFKIVSASHLGPEFGARKVCATNKKKIAGNPHFLSLPLTYIDP